MPRTIHSATTLLLLTAALCCPALAHAATPSASAGPPLEWKWQRFRAWEYPASAAALGLAFYLRFAGPTPSADWKGGILFDDWVSERASIQSTTQRRRVAKLTDLFFYGSMGYRFVDSALVPSLVWRSPDVAFQMTMIDLESFAFVSITLWGTQALFGRERPLADHCADPAFSASEHSCLPSSNEHNRSFYAGHPAVVLTAAGLTCTHHSHFPLYGGGAGDTLACGMMIGAAAMTGVGRIVTDNHHASDVVVGYGIGAFAGWALPAILHYRHRSPALTQARSSGPPVIQATLIPMLDEHQLGLGLGGIF